MTLRLQIDYYNEYRCECKTLEETKVSKQQIAYNLVRCNPLLAKYLSKNITYTETVQGHNQMKREDEKPYRSIVDERNLNILLTDKYPPRKPVSQQPQQRPDAVRIKIDNYIDSQVQTSPLLNIQQPNKPHPKQKLSPTEQQLRNYYRQLRLTSRYLSDTAFRKYFNRQVFQNYGRENTHGTNDGIIYGNYLKTHNVNPHAGENIPHDEETFYHALISASPEKFLSPNSAHLKHQQKTRSISQSRFKENQSFEKPLKKHQNNPDEIIMDNLHQHDKLNKLSRTQEATKMYSSRKGNLKLTTDKFIIKHSPIKQTKSPRAQQPTSPRIQSQYVNTKQYIQPIKPANQRNEVKRNQLSPRINQRTQNQEINKLSGIKANKTQNNRKSVQIKEPPVQKEKKQCPVNVIRENNMDYILAKDCNVKKHLTSNKKSQYMKQQKQKLDFGPGSPKTCSCNNSGKCKYCLSPLKKQLKIKAEEDVDLSNRLITSARKTALYKNYSLNNVDNGKLNPHNYSRCHGEIYEG